MAYTFGQLKVSEPKGGAMSLSYREHNDAATAQLRGLAETLTLTDLDRPLGGGWTVKAALAHMAFWDRLAASLLEEWQQAGAGPALIYGEDLHLNRVCLRDWLALPAEHVLREVVEAATLVDQCAARVGETLQASILAAGEGWACLRYRHRHEHLAQMGQTVPDISEPAGSPSADE
jgi:hypothetical protein